MARIISVLLVVLTLGCGRYIDYVKERADARWKEAGFEIAGYAGYNLSIIFGGKVWYFLKRADTPGVLYIGFLARWFDEIHMYNVSVVSGNQFNHTVKE